MMKQLFVYRRPDGHIDVLDRNEAIRVPNKMWTHLATIEPKTYIQTLLSLNPHIVTQLQEAMVNVSE